MYRLRVRCISGPFAQRRSAEVDDAVAALAGGTDEKKGIPPMAKGTVKWFNATKGYGFIEPEEGGKDVFVHISALERAGLRTLQDGQAVTYEIGEDQRGRSSAENIVVDG